MTEDGSPQTAIDLTLEILKMTACAGDSEKSFFGERRLSP